MAHFLFIRLLGNNWEDFLSRHRNEQETIMKTRTIVLLMGVATVALLMLGCTSHVQEDFVAINVALNPGDVMVAHANAASAAMRADYPDGFEFDQTHIPHITLVQRFVRAADLEQVYGALESVLREEDPSSLQLEATAYYYSPMKSLGLAGIVVDRTEGLVGLHERVIEAVAPYTINGGTAAAFFTTPEEPVNTQPSIDYVEHYVPRSSGENFHAHVTVGLASQTFLDRLKAEPFEHFTFSPASVSVYQLGDFGTCRKLLKQW